jgi:hypothetical protein
VYLLAGIFLPAWPWALFSLITTLGEFAINPHERVFFEQWWHRSKAVAIQNFSFKFVFSVIVDVVAMLFGNGIGALLS